jgi:hypothetical protein
LVLTARTTEAVPTDHNISLLDSDAPVAAQYALGSRMRLTRPRSPNSSSLASVIARLAGIQIALTATNIAAEYRQARREVTYLRQTLADAQSEQIQLQERIATLEGTLQDMLAQTYVAFRKQEWRTSAQLRKS